MKSLFINTTEKLLSLAVKDGSEVRTFCGSGEKTASEEIFVQMEKLLQGIKISELDFVVVLNGPGSFTGIRLGLSVVKGFMIAVGVPVITVDNFRAVWDSLEEKNECYVVLNAGIGDVYVEKISELGDVMEGGRLLKKSELQKVVAGVCVIENAKINAEKVLCAVEKSFDKAKFVQAEIEPLYIKPHYATAKK